MVPCRACLWFLRNLGSVPLSDGYLLLLGFLILYIGGIASVTTFSPGDHLELVRKRTRSCEPSSTGYAERSSLTLLSC